MQSSSQALPESFQRIDEKSYLLQYNFENQPREVIFEIDDRINDPEFRYYLANEAKERFLTEIYKRKKPDLATFKLANKTWKCTKQEKVGQALKLASAFTTFVHKHDDDNVTRLKISRADRAKVDAVFKEDVNELKLSEQLRVISTTPLHGSQIVTPDEFEAGVRGKEGLIESYNIRDKDFTDPYTSLATIAYQKHEKVFHPADFFDPDHCEYAIVARGDELNLVRGDSKGYSDPVKNRKTIAQYKNFLIKEYGEDKINYIQYLYKFEFDKLKKLTPEVVFRVNMGITNLEVQDLKEFMVKLTQLQKKLEASSTLILSNTLDEIYESGNSFEDLTGRETRGLYKFIQGLKGNKEAVTLEDVKKWIETIKPHNDVNQLSNKQLNQLMAIFYYGPEEVEGALTGRKIYDYMQGYYTSAGREEYKAYVDQQQLVQMLQSLEECKSDMEYHELLSHVISKIHLVREHPTEGYRVGAIIPGPRSKAGEQRWYKVSSCCSNRHGIFSYTLEPICQDATLKPIKLYRSTASSSYFMHSSSSLLNDINSLNSPGYEGMGKGDTYEAKFFDERTIPIWVGYLTLANEGIQKIGIPSAKKLNLILKDLKKANSELVDGFHREHQGKSLKEILRSNDATLNDLLLKNKAIFGLAASNVDSQYSTLYSDLIAKYIRQEVPQAPSDIYKAQVQVDAATLIDELDKFPKKQLTSDLQNGIDKIKQELFKGVLGLQKTSKEEREFQKFLKALENYENEVTDLIRTGNHSQALNRIKEWASALSNEAKFQGENLESKKFEDIVFSGHSLGAAAGGAHTMHFTTERHRIPLPQHICQGFFFDSPGINEENNRHFIEFGIQHEDLFKRLCIGFEINHSLEAGDLVTFGGEVHFGITLDESTALKIRPWCRFYAEINQRLPSTKKIAKVLTAHATRFQLGEHLRTFIVTEQKERADYIKTTLSSDTLGLIDKKGRVPSTDPVKRKKDYDNLLKGLLKVHPKVSILVEHIRRSDHPVMTLYKRILKASENVRGDEFLDQNGVFYVSEKGVESVSVEA